ncbi:hypothetical protein [Neorhizobium sp. JUb45]|uniref:hypothetical protein n=1 Tax=Neorhizobium sp. JUb45 TaxID=2485113 RepID=UPI0010480733|nr:hypothetical protein [Neorhizobium sp. JUb45]TCR02210.1 hypothetical protein EDF70_104493 [Neorhizobium sp. JUb45]
MSSLVKETLKQSLSNFPLYLRSFHLDVIYNDGMAPDEERREVLEEAFSELEDALRLGFFCWERFSTRETAEVHVGWSDEGNMSVAVSSEGVHHNALVAAIRIVARLHHTSREGYEAMRTLLGEDADALSQPTSFRENVASLEISNVKAAEQGEAAATDVLNFTGEGISFPAFAALRDEVNENYTGDRLIVTSSAGQDFPAGDLDEVEDCFLSLFGSGVFTSISNLDSDIPDNEAEIFTRQHNGQVELLFGDYGDQKYGMLEFLNVVAGGRIANLNVRSESDG